jgi:hypothetical protein
MAFVRWGVAATVLGLAMAPASFASAPATASQDGQVFAEGGRMVAFNEESVLGKHAIQLFDAQGKLVRDLSLADFLSKDYIAALPSDAAGLHWRRDTKLVGDAVEFDVVVPGAEGASLHFSIDVNDGLVRTAQIREYLAAADQARSLAAAQPVAVAGAIAPHAAP